MNTITLSQQLMTSFIASAGFGIIFQAPKTSLIKCGLVGMSGWLVYFGMVSQQMDPILATLAGASVVAILSHLMAKRFKKPSIIFSVMGIIPLVPGGLAYHSMRKFVENDYGSALALAAEAFMLSGAIAFGLVCSEVVNQVWKKGTGESKQERVDIVDRSE